MAIIPRLEGIVLREETYLEAKLGESYLVYKQLVPRRLLAL